MTSSHRDYEPFEMAENMEEDLGLFEAAAHARRIQLAVPSVRSALAALDGSNQDATVQAIGQRFASRYQADVRQRADLKSGRQIREAVAQQSGELLLVPVPFGEDIDELASQSLGSVADTLLQDCPVPLLCVRQPLKDDAVQALFNHVVLPISVHNADAERALAWACWISRSNSELVLLELPDRQLAEEVRREGSEAGEMPSVRGAALNRAMTDSMGSLVSAAQRSSTEHGFAVRTEFRAGARVAEVKALAADLPSPLVVTARCTDHTSAQFHFMIDLLLNLHCPLLLV